MARSVKKGPFIDEKLLKSAVDEVKNPNLFYSVVDKTLNGLNKTTDQLIRIQFMEKIGQFFKQAPAHLTVMVASPVWRLRQASRDTIDKEKQLIYTRIEASSFSISLSALLTLVFLIVFFLK